ncbi:hypothetical protein [Myroides odoratimimus]|uniref:hypothetical protein n=1 Tax=Myroides odoratimimus TaxID=76832 RepID=UPI002577279F|nr:hypothetical protein [Myroides odoratimimus]MDM1060598.1 hypothetical protein [Myroides odoratimimus]
MKKILLFMALLTSAFSVSIINLELINLFFVFLLAIIALPTILIGNFRRDFVSYFLIWLLPFIISLGFSLPLNILMSDADGLFFHEISPYGRIANLIMLTLFVFYTYLYVYDTNSKVDSERCFFIIKAYFFSCCIMVFTAIWQWLNFNGLLSFKFPLETRSFAHGNTSLTAISNRVTGLAMEPSFLVPFVSEFIIIGFFIIKKKILKFIVTALGVFVIFYSFSPSGYLSLLGLFLTYFYFQYRLKAIIISLIVLFFVSGSFMYFKDIEAFVYFSDRIAGVSVSSRYETIYYLVEYMLSTDYFTLLFGNGFKTLSVLQLSFPNAIIYETSNNLFLDVFFECGIIGVFLMIWFFTKVLKLLVQVRNRGNQLFVSLLMVNFIVTSLFRADYSSIRVFFILLIVYMLCISDKKIHVLNEKY